MPKDEHTPKTDAASPAKPKPEEQGRPVPSEGKPLEPEAMHNNADGAVRAGDRMWGPAGTPKT